MYILNCGNSKGETLVIHCILAYSVQSNPCIYIYIYVYICIPVYVSIYLSTYLSIYQYTYILIYLLTYAQIINQVVSGMHIQAHRDTNTATFSGMGPGQIPIFRGTTVDSFGGSSHYLSKSWLYSEMADTQRWPAQNLYIYIYVYVCVHVCMCVSK